MTILNKNALLITGILVAVSIQIFTGLKVGIEHEIIGAYLACGSYLTLFLPFIWKFGWLRGTKFGLLLLIALLLAFILSRIVSFLNANFFDWPAIVPIMTALACTFAIFVSARVLEVENKFTPLPVEIKNNKPAWIIASLAMSSFLLIRLAYLEGFAVFGLWSGAILWYVFDNRINRGACVLLKIGGAMGGFFLFSIVMIITLVGLSPNHSPLSLYPVFHFLLIIVIHASFVAGQIWTDAKQKS